MPRRYCVITAATTCIRLNRVQLGASIYIAPTVCKTKIDETRKHQESEGNNKSFDFRARVLKQGECTYSLTEMRPQVSDMISNRPKRPP